MARSDTGDPDLTSGGRSAQTAGDLPRSSQDVLEQLYRTNASWLRRRLRALNFGDLPEDVVQDTFLRIYQQGGASRVQHPRAFLLKVALNIARNAIRRETSLRRAPPRFFPADFNIAPRNDQLEMFALKQAILALPPIYRDIFVMSRFDGMTYQQIAETLGLSVKTVEWRMSRALAMCAARMRE